MQDVTKAPAGFAGTLLADGATPSGGKTSGNIREGGLALADLIKQVGSSVASTQQRLNEICANTANELAKTTVEVTAARSKVYDDETGELKATHNMTLPLPLVNFIDPVNYELTQVRIQGMFQASEISTDTQTADGSTTYTGGASMRVGALFSRPGAVDALARVGQAAAGSGADRAATTTTGTTTGRTSESESVYGQVRMNAEMRPRHDIGVPKPNHVIRGPNLLLVPQETRENWRDDGDKGRKLLSRDMIVNLSYRKRATTDEPEGAPLKGFGFAIEAPGLLWSYCDAVGDPPEYGPDPKKRDEEEKPFRETDDDGMLYILIHRDLSADGVDASQRNFLVSARIGMVQNSAVVTL